MHIAIEWFFAVLPLLVLGAFWPDASDAHPKSFFESPEWSMTACILYGLSLARFQNAKGSSARNRGPTVAAISILPLLGVIVSVILISKTAHGTESISLIIAQFVNLLLSTVSFVVLGGYGVSRSE